MTDAGLVLNDQTEISYQSVDNGWCNVYHLNTRYGLSTREILLWRHFDDSYWNGWIIEFGTWRDLDEDEIEQCKEFLKEKGYLR